MLSCMDTPGDFAAILTREITFAGMNLQAEVASIAFETLQKIGLLSKERVIPLEVYSLLLSAFQLVFFFSLRI